MTDSNETDTGSPGEQGEQIEGFVFDQDRNPLPGVPVLFSMGTNESMLRHTDGEGHYSFERPTKAGQVVFAREYIEPDNEDPSGDLIYALVFPSTGQLSVTAKTPDRLPDAFYFAHAVGLILSRFSQTLQATATALGGKLDAIALAVQKLEPPAAPPGPPTLEEAKTEAIQVVGRARQEWSKIAEEIEDFGQTILATPDIQGLVLDVHQTAIDTKEWLVAQRQALSAATSVDEVGTIRRNAVRRSQEKKTVVSSTLRGLVTYVASRIPAVEPTHADLIGVKTGLTDLVIAIGD